jgi:hypothetical protein
MIHKSAGAAVLAGVAAFSCSSPAPCNKCKVPACCFFVAAPCNKCKVPACCFFEGHMSCPFALPAPEEFWRCQAGKAASLARACNAVPCNFRGHCSAMQLQGASLQCSAMQLQGSGSCSRVSASCSCSRVSASCSCSRVSASGRAVGLVLRVRAASSRALLGLDRMALRL